MYVSTCSDVFLSFSPLLCSIMFCFLKREKEGVESDGRGSGKDLGDEGLKSVIRIHCILKKKSVFPKKERKKSIK